MNNNIKKLVTITAVLFLSLSPALAPTRSVSAENVTSTAPDSGPSEKGHRPHQGKTGNSEPADISLFSKQPSCLRWIVRS